MSVPSGRDVGGCVHDQEEGSPMSAVVPPAVRTYASDAATRDAPRGSEGRAPARPRVASLDVIRGAVMLLMAIDHVRVYSGLPPGGPTPGIFFTRWVTHFAAPAFVFLAGTGAYLHGERLGRRSELSRFLVTRGAWLILLELTVIRVAWTFNLDYPHYLLAGVLWMIGWCMILMAALVHLPLRALGAFAAVVIAGHNVMDAVAPALLPTLQASRAAWLWQLLYFGGTIDLGSGGPQLAVLYVIVPWVGVMAAGYAFGPVLRMTPERRRRVCLALGLGAVAAFLVLRGFDLYGDPRPWRALAREPGPGRMPAPLAFLATTKYPASLLFLLMTLGPTVALIPLAERARGAATRTLAVFGRVPLFYYVLHIPVIHAAACAVSLLRYGQVVPWLFANHPMMNPPAPAGYAWTLPLLYLVAAAVVALLYVPCRWYAGLKARRRDAWLSYL
jgi:uncharacterized membrane protein